MSFLARLFAPQRDRRALLPLYEAVVARARDPFWYRDGGVPDTLEGRFEMVAAVLALVLVRIEAEGDAAASEGALLTELFVEDMDGTIRELGIGDVVVGKKVGKLVGALGARVAAFREADAAALEANVRRNVFRDAPPSESVLALVAGRLGALRTGLAATPLDQLLAGQLP